MIELIKFIFKTNVLKNIDEYPNYQFNAIEHNLGGAVASIDLYETVNKVYNDLDVNEPKWIIFEQSELEVKNLLKIFIKKLKL